MTTRRDFLRSAAAGGAMLLPARLACAARKRPPNVLLILADDMGPHLSALNTPGIRTPNLDALASQGVLLTRAYSSCASCSPSRASILTGMWPHACGIFHNVHAIPVTAPPAAYKKGAAWRGPRGILANVPTAHELLAAGGYYTGITQKLHVGPGHRFAFHYRNTWRYTLDRTTRAARPGMYQGMREFLRRAADKPFFLLANITLTHRPFQAQTPDRCRTSAPDPARIAVPPLLPDVPEVRRDLARYYGTVQMTDAQVGEILAALRDAGADANTIVLFTSDHGWPYHRGKASIYEAGIHVPLIARAPDAKPGRRTDAMVSLIDLLPTVLDYAGLSVPAGMQGRSIRPVLQGRDGATGRALLFAEHNSHGPSARTFYPSRSARGQRYKYIRNLLPDRTYILPADLVGGGPWHNDAYPAVERHKAKFPLPEQLRRRTLRRPAEELYDLRTDPHEVKDLLAAGEKTLSRDLRQELARLRQAVNAWMKSTHDRGAKLM